MEMTVRQFTPDDKTDVIELWQRCGLISPENNPERDIERKIKVNPELFLVGEINGEVVATAMGGYEGHRGWVNYLAVAPEYRENGFGRQLMNSLEIMLVGMGCPKINLNIRTTNTDVLEFYEKIGYRRDEVITMSKRLEKDEPFKENL